MSDSGVINKTCLVYGQMNEPPGARLRVGLAGLTEAEYFRDQGQDVLLFVDNIFRFTQAGSEVSALLGRMPSAVGYQPTLATEMGDLQERITSTFTGSITSVPVSYTHLDVYKRQSPSHGCCSCSPCTLSRCWLRSCRPTCSPLSLIHIFPLTRLSPIPFPYLVYRSNTRSFMPASSSMDMASSSGYGFW